MHVRISLSEDLHSLSAFSLTFLGFSVCGQLCPIATDDYVSLPENDYFVNIMWLSKQFFSLLLFNDW